LNIVSVVEHQSWVVVATVANVQYSLFALAIYEAAREFPEGYVVRVSAVIDALCITSELIHSDLSNEIGEF
jgi:hypothetical protein